MPSGGQTGLRDEDLSGDGRLLFALDADCRRTFGWAVGDDGTLSPLRSSFAAALLTCVFTAAPDGAVTAVAAGTAILLLVQVFARPPLASPGRADRTLAGRCASLRQPPPLHRARSRKSDRPAKHWHPAARRAVR